MNRNVESHFALNPTNIDIRRSTFDRSHSLKTSFNVGDIVPFFVDEVLPGDTFNVDTSKVVRLQTLLTPVMDNIYLDTYFFFVPNRLTWSHWKQFNGENTESAWIPQTEYEIPQITAPADAGWSVGTIADYLGVPTGVPNLSVSALPFRAYVQAVNSILKSLGFDVTGGSTSGEGSVSAEQYAKLMEKYNAALLGSGPKRSKHQR